MKSHPLKIFLLVFAGTLGALVFINWNTYFNNPFHEQGDIALNALQVAHAKDFHELYGNYSRFQFNHPGPAFFYLYAFGETVLCDWLHLNISPHNAHSLAGLAAQCAFFALGLTIAAGWIRARLFLPLALLAAAIHFSVAGYAFWSIWPPHVLLMPFLAFWVACLSVACGRGEHVGWAVLAGSFLVHGHVAQPLFVLGLFVPAYLLLVWQLRRSNPPTAPWRSFPLSHLSTALVAALFITPLVIDLRQGAESNIAHIFRHLHYNSEQYKKPVKAVLYFLSFFGYERDQDQLLDSLSWRSLSFFRAHWPAFTAWFSLLCLAGLGLRHATGSEQAGSNRFLRHGAIGWLYTALLCVIWGMVQTGAMYEFNGYFYHGINYVLALGLVALLAQRLGQKKLPRGLGTLLCLLAVAVAGYGFARPPLTRADTGLPLLHAARAALAADPNPDKPKLLAFAHDDWPDVAAVALALQRQGSQFYVGEMWRFMYQRRHVIPPDLLRLPQPPLSVWRFIRGKTNEPSVPFGNGLHIVFTPAALSPVDGLIDFSEKGNYENYVAVGLTTPQGRFSWTSQADALLQFRPEKAEQDVELWIEAEPYLPKGLIKMQPTELRFNGRLLFSAPFTEPGVLRVRVTAEIWNQFPVASIHIYLPNASSPSELGISGDLRVLSLAFKRLTTRAATNPRP